MSLTLLAETLGEDTATQLLLDGDGAYHVRILRPREPGKERTRADQAVHVYHQQRVEREEAEALFHASAARRHVEEGTAFP